MTTPEDNDKLTAAAGWFDVTRELCDALGPIEFPKVTIQRGGIKYPTPGSPEWEQAQMRREVDDSMRSLVSRLVANIVRAQDDALSAAYIDALNLSADTGLIHDVHQHQPPDPNWRWRTGWGVYRFIGISVEPRTEFSLVDAPMVYIHPDYTYYEDD